MSNTRTPTKKTAAKKTTARTSGPRPVRASDKPAAVGFNFDTWQRDEAVEPFPIVIAGKRYESLDPISIDFREVMAALESGTPQDMFQLLFPDDYDEIMENKIPLGSLRAFADASSVHFGLEDFVGA